MQLIIPFSKGIFSLWVWHTMLNWFSSQVSSQFFTASFSNYFLLLRPWNTGESQSSGRTSSLIYLHSLNWHMAFNAICDLLSPKLISPLQILSPGLQASRHNPLVGISNSTFTNWSSALLDSLKAAHPHRLHQEMKTSLFHLLRPKISGVMPNFSSPLPPATQ